MTNELFNSGLAFKQAVQSRQIPPHQFGSLLQDICTDQPGLKPALLDLCARQVFREIMMHEPTTQKILAKDRLLSELRPLYRVEIVAQLTAFIDGALDSTTIDHIDSGTQTTNEGSPHKLRQHGIASIAAGSFYADNPNRLLLLSVLSLGAYTFYGLTATGGIIRGSLICHSLSRLCARMMDEFSHSGVHSLKAFTS